MRAFVIATLLSLMSFTGVYAQLNGVGRASRIFYAPDKGVVTFGTSLKTSGFPGFQFYPNNPVPSELMGRGIALPLAMMNERQADGVYTSAPVTQGEPIYIYSKQLTLASTSIDILDSEEQSVVYDENAVFFDPVHNVVRMNIKLKPGIYTLKVPLGEEIISKTIIVQ